MNYWIKICVAWCCIFFLSGKIYAQDIHFSQFYENSVLRNPALTGIFSGDYRVVMNYRNQWSSIAVPFQTAFASVETRIGINNDVGDYLSFGLAATYDRAGSISFNSLQVYPAINFNKAIEDRHQSYFSAGFTAGYVQRSVDPNKMRFASQYTQGSYNPSNPSGENITQVSMDYLDIGAGISFNSSLGEYNQVNYYLGAAAYHINRPKAAFSQNESFLRLKTRWSGNFGLQWAMNSVFGLTTHFNYTRQGVYQETIGGALLSWRNLDPVKQVIFVLHGGLFYRWNDAFIPTLKMDYKNYSVTISYDMTTSALRTVAQGTGGMEISVILRGELTRGPWAQDNTRCPRFEHMLLPAFE
jgi:type IX secretion system PorP/SprF family membrane protein